VLVVAFQQQMLVSPEHVLLPQGVVVFVTAQESPNMIAPSG
jgi:hypothetical protein